MTYVGIDLHKRESQICIMTATGDVKQVRIRSTKSAISEELEGLKRAKVLLESSTSSEWVARTIESLGHEVIVADPNYAPMMGSRRKRKVKTDQRDALALAEACRIDAYRPAHRMSDADRRLRGELAVRSKLVGMRTSLVTLVRSLLLQYGEPVASCDAEHFAGRMRELSLSDDERAVVEPALAMIESICKQLTKADAALEKRAGKDETAQLLTSVPGVGPITALMFTAVMGNPERFASAAHASAYIGLVPGENSSGDGVRRTRITKTGNSYLRSLLVQCAWSLIRSRDGGGLRQWARRLGEKRGKRVAAVALARRLARILWALWKRGTPFDPSLHPVRQLEVSVVPVTN